MTQAISICTYIFLQIQFAYSILTHILPSFHRDVSLENQKQIISFAGQLLPLLNDCDGVKLCVVLPVLSTAILNITNVKGHESLSESLVELAPYLVEFALNRDQDSSARAAAVSCIFSIGAKFQTNSETCLCKHLLSCIICPKIILAVNMNTSFAAFEDAIKLCALMVRHP